MKNIQFTFDFQDYVPRKTANQKLIEAEFKDVFTAFVATVEQSFREAKRTFNGIKPMKRGRNLFAELLNGNICGSMYDQFPNQCKRVKHGRMACVINGTVAFFKNLYDNHRPKRKETLNSIALEENIQPKHCTEQSVIWFGYTVSKDKSCITGIYVNHLNNDPKKSWEIDLYDWIVTKDIDKISIEPISENEPALKKRKQQKEGNNI